MDRPVRFGEVVQPTDLQGNGLVPGLLTVNFRTAPDIFSHDAVLLAVGTGQDPFQQRVWDRLNAIEGAVAQVAQQGAANLGTRTAAVSRVEGLIAPLVVVALALALLLSWLAARRMSHPRVRHMPPP